MKKVRASRPARSGPTAPKRDTKTSDTSNGASREPSHARLLELQASGGNRAVRRLVSSTAPTGLAQRAVMSAEDFEEASTKIKQGFFGGSYEAARKRIAIVDDALAHFHDNRFVAEDASTVDMDDEEAALRATNDVDNLIRLQDAVKAYINAAGEDSRGGVGTLRDQIATELTRYSELTHIDITAQRTKLNESVTGDLGTIWTKAKYLLDLAAPTAGTSASLELSVKIPIPHTPAFLGGKLSLDAERGEDDLKTRCEIALVGGVHFVFGQFQGTLGGYIEASGKDSDQVVKLLDYGLYNRFRESKMVPSDLTNLLWGRATGMEGQMAAEQWAQAVETETWSATKQMLALVAERERIAGEQVEALENGEQEKADQLAEQKQEVQDQLDVVAVAAAKEEGYVESGGYLGAEGELGIAGFGKGTASVQFSSGRKITGRGVQARKGIGESRTGKFSSAKPLGKSTRKVTIKGGVSGGGVFSGGVSLGLLWEADDAGERPPQFKNVTLGLSATGTMPATSLVGGGIGPAIIAILEQAVAIKELMAAKLPEGKMSTTEKAKVTGAVVDHLGGFGLLASQLASQESFVPKFEATNFLEESSGAKLTGSVGLKLGVAFDFLSGKKATVGLDYIKSYGLSVPLLEIKLEKTKNLFSKSFPLGSTESTSESD